jgi:hypothetical protein
MLPLLFKAPPVNSFLQLFTSAFPLSQSRSQSTAAASSPFARIQYEGVLRDLLTLQGSLEWVADKGTALSWAELFGKLMVCRRLPFLQFHHALTDPRVTLEALRGLRAL